MQWCILWCLNRTISQTLTHIVDPTWFIAPFARTRIGRASPLVLSISCPVTMPTSRSGIYSVIFVRCSLHFAVYMKSLDVSTWLVGHFDSGISRKRRQLTKGLVEIAGLRPFKIDCMFCINAHLGFSLFWPKHTQQFPIKRPSLFKNKAFGEFEIMWKMLKISKNGLHKTFMGPRPSY